MSFGKINLRLPRPGELKLAESISTRASNPTDDADTTPINSQNPFISDPLPERPKSLQSSETLKNCLRRTSEKLKNYTFLSAPSNFSNTSGHSSEIFKLQQQIEELENENKKLVQKNKQMAEKLEIYEKIPEKDEDISKILKYAQFFVGKVKRNSRFFHSFSEIFDSESKILAEIKADNTKKVLKDLFLFVLENFDEKRENGIRSQSTTREDRRYSGEEVMSFHRKSDTLAQNISEQKLKIQKIYEDLKVSVDRSKMVLTSGLGVKRNPFSDVKKELTSSKGFCDTKDEN